MTNVSHVYVLEKSLNSFLFAVCVHLSSQVVHYIGMVGPARLALEGKFSKPKALQSLCQAEQLDL